MQSHQVAGKSHDIVDPSLGREVMSEGQPCPSLAIADPPHAAHSAAAGAQSPFRGGIWGSEPVRHPRKREVGEMAAATRIWEDEPQWHSRIG